VLEVARAISANGPVAVRAAKDAIDHGSELPLEQGLAHEARCYERTLGTQDRLEALAAFAEKRKPVFRGS
jgi:methylglutaconyl-CoA hydratase